MRLELVCLSLLLCPCFPNPIVSIMLRKPRGARYQHASNGVIVKQNLIMTTLFPVAVLPIPVLCVLVEPRKYENGPRIDVIKHCLQVEKIVDASRRESPSNFAIVMTYGNIVFTFGITKAVFNAPFICGQGVAHYNVVHNLRMLEKGEIEDIVVYPGGMSDPGSKGPDNRLFTCKAKLDKTLVGGFMDNGLPLFCQAAVLGLLNNEHNDCADMHIYKCIKQTHKITGGSDLAYVALNQQNLADMAHVPYGFYYWKEQGEVRLNKTRG